MQAQLTSIYINGLNGFDSRRFFKWRKPSVITARTTYTHGYVESVQVNKLSLSAEASSSREFHVNLLMTTHCSRRGARWRWLNDAHSRQKVLRRAIQTPTRKDGISAAHCATLTFQALWNTAFHLNYSFRFNYLFSFKLLFFKKK